MGTVDRDPQPGCGRCSADPVDETPNDAVEQNNTAAIAGSGNIALHSYALHYASTSGGDEFLRVGEKMTVSVDFDDAKDVPASLVSEGTLVVLALVVLLHSKAQPRLLLLDDLGAELHPTAQGELVALLQAIQAQNPNLQIVASTHSPYVLDAVAPQNVLVFARGADGAARVRCLDQHADAKLEGITTGQLWTMDPETWVLQGNT